MLPNIFTRIIELILDILNFPSFRVEIKFVTLRPWPIRSNLPRTIDDVLLLLMRQFAEAMSELFDHTFLLLGKLVCHRRLFHVNMMFLLSALNSELMVRRFPGLAVLVLVRLSRDLVHGDSI